MNLNYYFGPSIPAISNVPISFITSSPLSVPNTLSVFSSDRYCPENYSFLNTNLTVIKDIPADKKLHVKWSTGSLGALNTIFPAGVTLEALNLTGDITPNMSSWGPIVVNDSISVKYVFQTEAGSWLPVIKQGVVWRKYKHNTASAGDSCWINSIGLTDGEDCILVYSVPEVMYQPREYVTDAAFPNTTNQSVSCKRTEVCSIIQDQTISYLGYIQGIYEIKINNTSVFSNVTPVIISAISIVDSNDLDQRTIKFKGIELLPEDLVTITYATPNDTYVYSGFQTPDITWKSLDLNPEFGHWCQDYNTGTYIDSKQALLQMINVFAVPTAVIRYNILYKDNTAGDIFADVDFKVYSAFDLGETHFVRHLLSSERSEIIPSREGAGSHSTYGMAVLGRNYYDEFNSNVNDTYSTRIPSMLPIAKFTSTLSPGSANLQTWDIRRRGGGIPDNFNFDSVATQQDGLDTLRSYFDLGIWEGNIIQKGGSVTIKIDPSVLKTSEDNNPNTFLASEIDEIVSKNILAGLSYEIIYTTV